MQDRRYSTASTILAAGIVAMAIVGLLAVGAISALIVKGWLE